MTALTSPDQYVPQPVPPHSLTTVLRETVQVVPQERVIFVDRPVFVDRVIEKVVQVPVHVPFQVHVPIPVQVPVPVHVPTPVHVPIPWPMVAPAPVPAPTLQHLHVNLISGGEAQRMQDPPRLSERALPAAQASLLLEAPPVLLLGPPPAVEDVDDGEDEPHTQSQKKRKFERLCDWPPEWRDKYEALKSALKLRGGPAKAKALWDTWDKDLQKQVFVSIGPERRPLLRQWELEAEDAASQSSKERRSQDWHEGARFGEADNPGPWRHPRCPLDLQGVHQNRSGSHAPSTRLDVNPWCLSSATTSRRGVCKVGIAPAPSPLAT